MLYPILKQRKILKVHVFSPSVPPENNTQSVSEVQVPKFKGISVCTGMFVRLLDYLLIFSYTVYIYFFRIASDKGRYRYSVAHYVC